MLLQNKMSHLQQLHRSGFIIIHLASLPQKNAFLILLLIIKKKYIGFHNFPASRDGTRKRKNPQYEITEMQEAAAVSLAAATMPVYQIKRRTKKLFCVRCDKSGWSDLNAMDSGLVQ